MSHYWYITTAITVAKLEYNTPLQVFCHKGVSITFRKLSNSQSIESSSAGEFHPHALTEPDVTVSHHPALIIRPQVSYLAALPYSLAPPIAG